MFITSLGFRILARRHVARAVLAATLLLAGGGSIFLARGTTAHAPSLCATPTPWDAMPATITYLYCPNN